MRCVWNVISPAWHVAHTIYPISKKLFSPCLDQFVVLTPTFSFSNNIYDTLFCCVSHCHFQPIYCNISQLLPCTLNTESGACLEASCEKLTSPHKFYKDYLAVVRGQILYVHCNKSLPFSTRKQQKSDGNNETTRLQEEPAYTRTHKCDFTQKTWHH